MKITRKQRNYLIAMSIGDGYIDKGGNIVIWHCMAQEAYVRYKYSLVSSLVTKAGIQYRDSKIGQPQVGFVIRTSKFTKLLRKVLYPNGVKTITRKILNRLDAECFALWWMDDGSCSYVYYKPTGNLRSTISTLSTCVGREENQVILDWILDKFGVQFGQRKMKNHFALTCRMRQGRLLANVLSDYIIPTMKYKLSI